MPLSPRNDGFTLLELLVAVAIIGVIALEAPNFWTWVRSSGYKNTYHQLQDALANAHNDALSQNTTSRLVVTRSGDIYTINSYVSSAPVPGCSTSGTWTQLTNETLKVPAAFQVTGAAMSNICFYRDGSSSGGTYTIAQKDGGTNIGFATITVLVATGYVDVDAN